MLPIAEINEAELILGIADKKLMPKYEDIPKEFKQMSNKWNRIFNEWFFKGAAQAEYIAKDGVDAEKALRHIRAIMVSFDPKHEHKEAAVAFLLCEWFEHFELIK
jgi:hypothetical protein